jgi:hypothetical protein
MVSLVTRPCLLHETSNCPAQCTNTHPPLSFWCNEGTAGRVTAILPAGGLLSPCDAGSRWSRFALTSEDVGRVITTTAGGVSSTTVLSVNGFQRTVVLDTVLMSAVGTTSGPFLICYVQDERVGANVNITIASTCSAGPNVTIANPAVESPPSTRVVVSSTNSSRLAELTPPVVDAKVLVDGAPGELRVRKHDPSPFSLFLVHS